MYVLHIIFGFLHAGYSYYAGFFQNRGGGNLSLYLTNTGLLDMSYIIESPGVRYFTAGTISGTKSTTVYLPSSLIIDSVNDQSKGIHLQTNSTNVTVIGQNVHSSGGDTFLALPTVKMCCTEYVYYGISVSSGAYSGSKVLMVGTENDTVMNLTVTQFVDIKVDDTVISLHRGIEYSFIVNRLQTVYIESSRDLTGTRIVTNKPVSVFSGHECGYVPSSRYSNCMHLIEQIPPTTNWGKTYYIAPLHRRSGYTIRVIAAYNSTEVITHCNRVNFYAINAGDNFTATHQSYCIIHSNKEILVAQYSHGYSYDRIAGNPMMILVPATVHYCNEINLSTISSSRYSNYINIIVLKEYYQPSMMYWITGGVKKSLQSQSWNKIHSSADALLSTVVYGVRSIYNYGHSGGFSIQKKFRGEKIYAQYLTSAKAISYFF